MTDEVSEVAAIMEARRQRYHDSQRKTGYQVFGDLIGLQVTSLQGAPCYVFFDPVYSITCLVASTPVPHPRMVDSDCLVYPMTWQIPAGCVLLESQSEKELAEYLAAFGKTSVQTLDFNAELKEVNGECSILVEEFDPAIQLALPELKSYMGVLVVNTSARVVDRALDLMSHAGRAAATLERMRMAKKLGDSVGAGLTAASDEASSKVHIHEISSKEDLQALFEALEGALESKNTPKH